MILSRERIIADAASTSFRPEVLERAARLISLLNSLFSHQYIKNRIVLKGGTALNLFIFKLPRLSIDIDLNYIGFIDVENMKAERPRLEKAFQAVCSREGLNTRRVLVDHAGGKWRLQYQSTLGGLRNLELDLNFLLRIPLWPIRLKDSKKLGSFKANNIPILDVHELAAGKLAALFSRRSNRDLFDAHQLLTRYYLDPDRLRLGFVLYGAMNRKDWRNISIHDVGFDVDELRASLLPVLKIETLQGEDQIDKWVTRLVKECQQALDIVLPFKEEELEFLNLLLDYGKIEPQLLTRDKEMKEKIRMHPALAWKALNVHRYRGI